MFRLFKQFRIFTQLSIVLILLSGFTCCSKTTEPVVKPDPTPPDTTTSGEYAPPFEGVPETKDIVMYEVNLRALSTQGNFAGVISRLDEIKALGTNVIWLMPIHPVGVKNSVGQLGSPYSVRNYKEVNPEFGNLEDFRTLVKEAHKRGMAVIIDWVANHTAWDNPWITAHKDWYSQDGNGNIIIPPGTNWQDVADLNFNNQEMRLEMIASMKYWIVETNIDGFRCDHADGVPYDFWKQAIDTLHKFQNRKIILLAEGSKSYLFTAGFQMRYSWDFYYKLKDVFGNNVPASQLFATNEQETNGLPPGAFMLRYTTNHDESAWEKTPMVFFNGKNGAMAASAIAICLGGVPLLYSSQEVGTLNNVPFFSKDPINWNQNPDMLAWYKKMMEYYNSSSVLRTGKLTTFNNSNMLVFEKTGEQDTLLVAVNVRGTTSAYMLPAQLSNTTWNDVFDNTEVSLSISLALEPYQIMILKKK